MLKYVVSLALSLLIVGFGQPSWIPILAPIAATFGYALFWWVLPLFSTRHRRFTVAFGWFFLVQVIQLSWMTSNEYQGVYILFVYVFLAMALGLQFGFLSLLVPKERILSLSRSLMLASAWVIFEWMRYLVLCGFTFNPVGLSLAANLYSLQFGALFGVLGLSFWVMFSNCLALNVMRHRKQWVLWLGVAAFPYFFGAGHLELHRAKAQNAPLLDVALVQTSLLPSEKVPLKGYPGAYVHPVEQWYRIFELVKSAGKDHFDYIVLPEAALPFLYNQAIYPKRVVELIVGHEISDEKVSNAQIAHYLATKYQAEVVAGFDGYDTDLKKYFNAAFHITDGREDLPRYDKRMLMPVAEYLPFKWAERFAASYGITAFFERGKEAKVFHGKVPFSVAICYDETFPHLVREGRVKGAELLITVTNDNWYPHSRLPQQHFDLGRLRTVENGVPLLRSCNSGITVGVDSLGRIIDKVGRGGSNDWERGIAAFQISTYHYRTPYLLWGNWGILILSTLLIISFWLHEKKVAQNK